MVLLEQAGLQLAARVIVKAHLLQRMQAGGDGAVQRTQGEAVRIAAVQNGPGEVHLLHHEVVLHGHGRDQPLIIGGGFNLAEIGDQILVHDLENIGVGRLEEIQVGLHAGLAVRRLDGEMQGEAGGNSVNLLTLDRRNDTFLFRHVAFAPLHHSGLYSDHISNMISLCLKSITIRHICQ